MMFCIMQYSLYGAFLLGTELTYGGGDEERGGGGGGGGGRLLLQPRQAPVDGEAAPHRLWGS